MGAFSNFIDNISSSFHGRNASWPMLAHEIVRDVDDVVLRYLGRSSCMFSGPTFLFTDGEARRVRAFLVPQMVLLAEASCIIDLVSVASFEDNERDLFVSEARDLRVFCAMRKELHRKGNDAEYHQKLCEEIRRFSLSLSMVREELYTGFKLCELYNNTIHEARKRFEKEGSSDFLCDFRDDYVAARIEKRPFRLFCDYLDEAKIKYKGLGDAIKLEQVWGHLFSNAKEVFVEMAKKARIPEVCEDFLRTFG